MDSTVVVQASPRETISLLENHELDRQREVRYGISLHFWEDRHCISVFSVSLMFGPGKRRFGGARSIDECDSENRKNFNS